MQHFVQGLFEVADDGRVHLIAGRRKSDGRARFPLPQGPEAPLYEPVLLPDEGILWSFTVQRIRPKSPPYACDDMAHFEPYAVGYVEVKGHLIVEMRLETRSFDNLCVGMKMRAGTTMFRTPDGREGLIPIFRPASEPQSR